MNLPLANPSRLRALTRACRRTGEVRRPRWWHWRRSRADRAAGDALTVHTAYRLAFCGVIACAGLAAAAHPPLGAQLLTLAVILMIQARIVRLRFCLDSDPALAVLAQFPLADRTLVAYQTRQRWRQLCWPTVDALGFWAVAWSFDAGSAPWLWLPVVAITHAVVLETLVLLLLRVWPMSGCLLFGGLGVIVWGTINQEKYPAVWAFNEPVLQTLAWATPMGWLNNAAIHLPQDQRLGLLIFALGLCATYALRWSYLRMQRTWALHPLWREYVGRPLHTWQELDAVDAADVSTPPAQHASTTATVSPDPVSGTGDPGPALAALAVVRHRLTGESLLTFGWAGRCTLARCTTDDRLLIDLLNPQGTGPSAWRWALLLAALPALCTFAEWSPHWGLTVLAAALFLKRMNRYALLASALLVGALIVPTFGRNFALVMPCAAAVLLAVPLMGGTWNGVPMGSTILGTMPRTWWRMMRLMVMLTGLRLVSGIPIMALVLFAIAKGYDAIHAAMVAAAWLTLVVSVPWICALRLIQRTPCGIDIDLGRHLFTALQVVCFLLHLMAAGLLLGGICQPVIGEGSLERTGVALISGSVGLSLVTSALHVALLRRAYRRYIDLLPPA